MLSGETDRDHMHLLVSMPPDVAPSRLIGTLKTQIAREVRKTYPEHVRKYLWGDAPFWSSSYFIASTGITSSLKALFNTIIVLLSYEMMWGSEPRFKNSPFYGLVPFVR